MAETIPDGLATPDAGDDYALVQDLGAFAATVHQALIRRANTRSGTQSQRLASTGLPDGTFWKDTTGERILWLRDNAQWVRIWPEPDRNVFRIGSYDTVLGSVFYNMRRLYQDGTTAAGSIELPGNIEDVGMVISNWLDGSLTNAIYMRRNGELGVRSGSQTRTIPFASAGGRVTMESPGPGQTISRQVSFPSGYFTQAPVVQVSHETDYPERVSTSIMNITTSGFTLKMHRTDANISVCHWSATQYREGTF